MEFKGTKGKWYVDTELNYINKYGAKVRVISSDEDEQFIEIFGNEDEDDANALLISKAPEMLEMLKMFYNTNSSQEITLSKLQDKVGKLIKKATKI